MILAEQSNVQGNDVRPRARIMINDGQRTWLDPLKLSPGTLTKFYVYIGYVNATSSSAQIRLQIWRPFNSTDEMSNQLIWEIKVTVDLTKPKGALYVVIKICCSSFYIEKLTCKRVIIV